MFSPIYTKISFTTAGQVDIPIIPPFIPANGNTFGPVDVRDIIAMQEAVSDEEYTRLRRRVIEQMRQPIERADQAETGTVNEYQCCVCDRPSSGPICDDYARSSPVVRWGDKVLITEDNSQANLQTMLAANRAAKDIADGRGVRRSFACGANAFKVDADATAPEPSKTPPGPTETSASGKDALRVTSDHEAVIEALRHQGYRTE